MLNSRARHRSSRSWRTWKIKAKVSSTHSLGSNKSQLSIHLGLTGSYDLRIWESLHISFMLRFCTARLLGIDLQYASYSFVQEVMIFARTEDLKRAAATMNTWDMNLLREQLTRFHHLQNPEHESRGKTPCTFSWYGWDHIEIYPSAKALQEVGDESQG